MFGERYAYDSEMCQSLHQLNIDAIKAGDPLSIGVLLDVFPFLFNFKFILSKTHKFLEETIKRTDDFFMQQIQQAKVLVTSINYMLASYSRWQQSKF